MTYPTARDAILVHAKASALAANAKWTDVAIGINPVGKCVRVFYGGERAPVHMGGSRVLNGELVSEMVTVAAFWPLSDLSLAGYKAVDDEMYLFKHELRTRVLGDSQLGGAQTDLAMDYAQPDIVVIGNVRNVVLEIDFITDYTEYALAP